MLLFNGEIIMEKSVGLQNFNTSNVTIQQNTSTFEDYTIAFQYI